MRVGFYHAAPAHTDHITCALKLVRSVREAMPGVELVQFTTPESVRVPGVDRCLTCATDGAPIALSTLEAYAAVPGDWLFVDTDVRVLEDVRPVFDRPFDLAVADRAGTLLEKERPERGRTFMQIMPYNKGAVFSRSSSFWQEAAAVCRSYKRSTQEWMGDQLAMNQVIAAGMFHVEILPSRYNYAPRRRDDDLSGQAIVHYKGGRKVWMLEGAA